MKRSATLTLSIMGIVLAGISLRAYALQRKRSQSLFTLPEAVVSEVLLETETIVPPYNVQLPSEKEWVHYTPAPSIKPPKATPPIAWDVTQVTLTNLTDQQLTLGLWGANRSASVRVNGIPSDEDATTVQPIGGYPQAVMVHPQTGFYYVADQLSGTVRISNASGVEETTIQLQPNFSGMFSPVAILPDPSNGNVYVAGAIADLVAVITPDHQVASYWEVGRRPMALDMHPTTGQLLVANYADNTLGMVNTTTGTTEVEAPTGQGPISIAVDEATGKIYTANSVDDTLTVFDATGTVVTTLNTIGTGPHDLSAHPGNAHLYAVATTSAELYRIDPLNDQVVATVQLANTPSALDYHPGFGQLVIAFGATDQFSVLDDLNQVIKTIAAPGLNDRFAVHPTREEFVYTAPVDGELTVLNGAGALIQVSEDYQQNNRDFQFQPAQVGHLRLFFSGDQRPDMMRIGTITPTGTSNMNALGMQQFVSPRQTLNLADVHGLKGSLIDGHTEWQLDILPQQTITALLYYRQVNRMDWLKKAAS